MSESVQETPGDQSTSATVTLRARGVYDPVKQLDYEQISAMKKRFRDSPELVGKAAVHIVDELFAALDQDTTDRMFDNQDELDTFKASTSRNWVECLELALELPDGEWPDRMTPPATFSEALKEMDAEAMRGNNNG